MNQVEILVEAGKVKEAIQVLRDLGIDDGTMLMSRYNRNEREKNQGTTDPRDYTVECNRIAQAAISIAKDYKLPQQTTIMQKDNIEGTLLQIIKECSKLNPKFAENATEILADYRAYKDAKASSAAFDVVGRRFKIIEDSVKRLQEIVDIAKGDAMENFFERISEILGEGIPNWDNLEQAYILVSGRGFVSPYVTTQIELKPSDDVAKLAVADEIENFVQSLGMKASNVTSAVSSNPLGNKNIVSGNIIVAGNFRIGDG